MPGSPLWDRHKSPLTSAKYNFFYDALPWPKAESNGMKPCVHPGFDPEFSTPQAEL